MGRSKFPGKPAKHVNKKRVNVLPCSSAKSNDTSTANNVFSDCAGADDAFCHTKEGATGDGSNPDDASCSEPNFKCSANIGTKSGECDSLPVMLRSSKPGGFLYSYSNYALKGDGPKSRKSMKRLMKKPPEMNALGKSTMHHDRKTFYTRKRQTKSGQNVGATSSRLHEKEAASLVGKFVLPSRSLHSSRVIIPNKRFINSEPNSVGSDCQPKSGRKAKACDKSDAGKHRKSACDSAKVRQVTADDRLKPDSDQSDSSKPCAAKDSVTDNPAQNSASTESSSKDASDTVPTDSSSGANSSWSCGKLVLRKARLQLHTQSSEGMDGPFSSYSTASTNPPGTVTCGVCGAVRFYRFVKQARKFNIYSCESCRKFISKMIKRQACSKNCSIPTLVCHKGQGMCHVPPIVRSQQWKLIRCAYKARCPACWLKMCLRSFQMPSQLKKNLTNMLPENMRSYSDCDNISLAENRLQKNHSSRQPENGLSSLSNGLLTGLQNKFRRTVDTLVSPLKLDILSSKTDTLLNSLKDKKQKKSRLRVPKKNVVTLNVASDITKRQKLDLKGPRVKHVCRSASIVLGQPLATFSPEPHTDPAEKNQQTCEVINAAESCTTCNSSVGQDLSSPEKQCTAAVNKSSSREQVLSTENKSVTTKNVCLAAPRKFFSSEPCVEDEQVENSLQPVIEVSPDYTDSCDTENKIFSTGFGLIGSEPFPIQAVCYYCGSAGQEQLIYCACCCEPYHYYCISDSIIYRYLNQSTESQPENTVDSSWKFFWICAQCTVCYRCGSTEKQKFSCQSCRRYFHPECMQSQQKYPDKPLICSSCLHCEDCGSKNISERICNVCLCYSCFILRMRGKLCPVCGKFEDHFNSKMLKCGECKCLVHVDCEELSEELFQIFSCLSGSFMFVCTTCTTFKKSYVNNFLNHALTNGFHIVLRLLSTNRTANELLKWNVIKNRTCTCKSDTVSKQITYTDNMSNSYRQNMEISKFNTNALASKYDSDKKVSSSKSAAAKSNMEELMVSSRCNNNDITEQDMENNLDASIKNMRRKFCIKECSVRIKNCADGKSKNVCSNVIRVQNGGYSAVDEKKIEASRDIESRNNKNHCCKHDFMPIVSLLSIKKKIYANIYKSVKEFHVDVKKTLKSSVCQELLKLVDTFIMDTFPWYNLNESAREENDISVSVNHPNFEVNNTQMNTHFQNEQSSIKANESSAVKIVCEVKPCAFDTRTCVLCGANGDGSPSLEGRLLYCGHNEWIHVNCAFWSDDVYEELDCSLQNVNEAVRRGRTSTCVVCKQLGATVECAARSCNDTFHYVCARTSQCLFSVKKVVYCSAHCGLSLHPSLIRGWDFELQRPLFIDFDRKTTKYIELSKVQFLIGSLNVTNLGTFFPPLSDTEDAIIPSEFVCSRLFWSIAEPWKIIKYTISTSVLMPTPKHMDSTERNFTIDHSLTRDEVEKKFMEIYKWNKDLECPKSKKYTHAAEYKKDSVNITDDDKVVLQVLEHVLELICSKEVEETCDDEPQNTTDLLPPELKDAIFEDLPHDLLDGISMQDIFPKLMSYEDVITVDLKNSDGNDCASSDCLKDAKNVCNENISDVDPDDLKGRKTDLYVTGNDFWLEPKYSIQSIDDFVQTNKIVSNTNGQELKRSKSEVLPGIKKITRTRNNQRSCSLTWSCKLDNSLTSNMKKRKMSCTSKSVADISSNLFMVVDGTNDKGNSGMLQELRLPDGVLMTVGHSTNVDYLSDTVREIKYRLEGNTVLSTDRLKGQSSELEQGKENKCRIWRNNNNKSQSRIVQVDGADDTSSSASDSESTTCEYQTEATTSIMSSRKYVQSPSKTSEEPVKCGRCQCTYRTHSSYKRHLTTCDFITSESDSDVSLTNEKCVNFDELPCVENSPSATLAPVDSKTMENIFVMSTNTAVSNAQSTTTVNSECLESSKFAANTYESNSASQPVVAPSISEHPENVGTENVQEMPKSACIPIAEAVAPNELPMNHIDAEITTTVASACTNVVPVTVSVPNSVQVPTKISLAKMPVVQKPIVNKPKNVKPRATKPVNRNKRTPKTMTIKRTDKTINPAGHTTGSVVSNGTSGPTVIIQHLSSPNMMPAYVEAFQHQTGQNLQCIATIVPNEYKPVQIPVPVPTPAPYFTSNSFVPGTFHLQSAESTNLIGLPNGGFSVISGQSHLQPQLQSQPAQIQPQSTVMGTLIQQSRPATAATIQCGVMSTEQLVLGSVPTLETIVTDAPGSMYFSSQPVYYGFETIVQNTVMSSQQFMSTTLPGVLASNSSYSATTQVFQTSKLEPVIDIHGTGYVLVNPSVTQLPAPITVPTPATITSVPSRPNIMTPQQQIFEPPPTTYPVQITSVCDSIVPTIEPVIYSEPVQTNTEQVVPCIRPQVINPLVYKPAESTMTTCVNSFPTATISSNIKEKIVKESKTSSVPSNGTSSSITLPVAPYAAENKIPMNIVTPTPQVTTSSSSQVSRPMNRVLPMQTAPPLRNMKPQPSNGNKILSLEPPGILNKLSETVDKIQESLINNDAESVQSTKANSSDNQLLKLESASLKLVFQKQSQDGIYKISNKYVSKNNMPIQITPLKQNKSRTVETIVNVKKDNVAQNKEALQNNSNKPVDNPSPNIVYKVHSQDGYDYSSTSLTEVWKNVFEAVQSARAAHNMPLLPKNAFNAINGLQLLGLNSNGLRYLIEQLPGAENCVKYKPLCQKKSKLADFKSSDIGQTSRAARCEPYNFTKQPYDMFSWLASKHRNPDYSHHFDTEYASRRSSSINLPMAMRFRQLKETSKHAVGVYRSSIHGRGLFCLRDIECGEMVIEYAGEVIRSTLTDKREKFYNSKGIGCYMFRVDDNFVIDATMKGNAARFINHSCDPNCYSRVLDILGHKHILIFALRKIMQGEELTYDYKFPFEEDKIPCTCGAKRCRKYLN